MRREVARLIEERKPALPVDYLVIEQLAQELVLRMNLAPEYRDFAMVLCGNEIWRPVVAATPFNRRLLLLPQCLKNNKNCQAVFDELGLICAGCRHCQIDGILQTAEQLGYATLVAEGTTVAVGLVEEGSIDAVVGVSCMSVLEKSFAPVLRAAVPVIGIPLLFDGCDETEVDKAWLIEEIQQEQQNPVSCPLSVSLIRENIRQLFTAENLLTYFGDDERYARKLAVEAMLQGGQRMRPVLAAIAYEAYSLVADRDLQSRLAVIIECFHKASLVHDDIEDADDFRYEEATLHRQYGMPLAINTGDYLIGKGYELLAELPLSTQTLQRCLKLVANAHVSLSLGQGDDLLSIQTRRILALPELEEVFRLKTGAAVKVALLLGALVAGAGENELQALSGFADLFGVAYQMRDDLNEFKDRNPETSLKHYPFLSSLLKQEMVQQNKNVDDRVLNESAKFLQLAEEYALTQRADDYLENQVQHLYRILDQLDNLRMKLSLYALVGKVFQSEKKSV